MCRGLHGPRHSLFIVPQGAVLRKFALLLSTSTAILFSAFAHAQQLDVAAGLGRLYSPNYTNTSSLVYAPSLRGITVINASIDRTIKNRFGLSLEVAFPRQQAQYLGYQPYRPVFYDLNAMYLPRIKRKFTAEFLAGIGGERILFYNQFSQCFTIAPGGCTIHTNSNHFLVHFSAGLRYYFWHNFFARGEAHLYAIPNNFQFSSDYVERVGGSVGYTFGSR